LFNVNAGPQLGLNAADPSAIAVLHSLADSICSEVKNGTSPSKILADQMATLRHDGYTSVTNAGTSGAITDALVYVCPGEQDKYQAEAGTHG
jgi:hypothetical protein